MSKRLQVLLPEEDLRRYQGIARKHKLPLGEWVRRALTRAATESEVKPETVKRAAIREALKVKGPTADIGQLNREIEQGYADGLP